MEEKRGSKKREKIKRYQKGDELSVFKNCDSQFILTILLFGNENRRWQPYKLI
jgi:hypothetical protein